MDDESFGPQLPGQFDFTLRFENIFFKIVPSIFLISSIPFYVFSVVKGARRVHSGLLLWLKLAAALCLVAVQIALLASASRAYAHRNLSTEIPIAAFSLSFISSLGIGFIIFVGHIYHYASPAFLGFFLTITFLLDMAVARSFSFRDGFETLMGLQIAVPVVKFLIMILEEISKRSLFKDPAARSLLGREAVAGFWSRSLFFWANGLLLIGFRRSLTKKDIGEVGFDTEYLHDKFSEHWKKANKSSKFALLFSCLLSVPEFFVFVIFPRLMSIGFDFAQPFLLQRVVTTVSHGAPDPSTTSSLIGATALIYIGKTVCTAWFSSYRNKLRIAVRGIIIAALFSKSLSLSADVLSKSAVLTLMSTDVNGVQGLVTLTYESWAKLIEVGLGLGILAVFVGPSCIFTLIPAVIASVCTRFATRKMAGTRMRWNERIESRIAVTSSMLSQMKELKMTGLAPIMADTLQQQMNSEIEVSMGDRHARTTTWAICALVNSVTPVLVIAATLFWTRAAQGLSVADFYTTIALTALVTDPFSSLLLNIPAWATAWASVQRVQKYMCMEEREDSRLITAEDSTADEKRPLLDPQVSAELKNVSVFSLRNVSLSVLKGGKTMLCGTVGAGKSTILKALLGELQLASGSVSIRSKSIAYCDQEPWILNATIEDNIVGENTPDEERLLRILRVCDLETDLARFPDGIRTLAGSEGCNLSGGQKQRVSLARALFDEADFLILDDVFSALDIPTSAIVRERLLGSDGFLKGTSTTLILATNIAQHLEHADVVLEITENGDVREAPERKAKVIQSSSRAQGSDSMQHPSADDEKSKSSSTQEPINTEDKNANGQQYGDWSVYAYFFGAAGPIRIVIWLMLTITAAVVEKFPPIYARIWLDTKPDSRIYFIGYAIFGVIDPICNMCSALAYFYLINAATAKTLHRTLADTTSRATLDFLTAEDTGVLLNRFSQDVSIATQELPLTVMPTTWIFFSILIDIGVIASGANYASPILPLFLLLVYGVQYFYLRTSRQLRFLELDMSKALYKQFKEASKGVAHIRAFQWQDQFRKQLHLAVNETQRAVYSFVCIQQWLASVLDAATAVAAVCVVTLALKFTSQTSGTAIGLALLSLISFSAQLSGFISTWTRTETSIGAVSRIREYSKSTPTEEDPSESKALEANVPESWPQSGQVELTALSACYQARSTAPRTAFTNVTVEIPSGKKVGIIGRTGSGKSSLLLAMLNLLEHSGAVTIDGLDTKKVPRQMLRSRITTITQSGIELPGSVRFNLNPFGNTIRPNQSEVTDDMMIDILRRIGSGLWESIGARGGLDAEVGKLQLSQGQMQLIQLARAVLHKRSVGTKIVLIDEGSASLDEGTERRVQTIMEEEFHDCTVLTVSHRPTALQNVDFCIRLVEGRAEVLQGFNGEDGSEPSD